MRFLSLLAKMKKSLSILISMKNKNNGEGQGFFPFFFFPGRILFFSLVLSLSLIAWPAAAKGAERGGLSRFDQLAGEATQLNKWGQYDKVISLLEPHKGEKKNDSALFFNELGVAYRNQGKLPEAIQAYQAGLFRDPENPVLMKNLGDIFFLNKEYPQAVEQYDKVLRGNPRFHQAHSGLGLSYYKMGRYREALEEFETVLKITPQDAQAQKFREEIQKKLKSPSR